MISTLNLNNDLINIFNMSIAIKIPDIGTTVTVVTLVKWLRQEGDVVKRGDFLCEIETDKATSELESIAEGTILKIMVPDGTELEQGTVIAYIGNKGETVPELQSEPALTQETNSSENSIGPQIVSTNIPPLIRNFAKNQGVDIGSVIGTGPGGRITKEDVMRAKEKNEGAPKKDPSEKSLSSNQAVIARRVVQSQHEIPPIHMECKINMGAVLKKRRETLEQSGVKISFDAFFIEAAAKTIKQFPIFRSTIKNEKIIESENISIGIAISYNTELYIPVIHNADIKAIGDINQDILQYLEKSKEGHFTQQELSGATFSVSNLGMFPVRSFLAVIPSDQSAILSIGAIEETPVASNNQVIIAPMAIFTLSVDHKLINGREAAEFLSSLKTEIEKT
jgi:pyruvate/2-oxoglutarate dehydrogenase complex dihydrolipoamide acyltransferase (E2) component